MNDSASSKPLLADLFCGAGGAAAGYRRAGFVVVGIDIAPQPRYAGDYFVQADALDFDFSMFDAVHASPPCQDHSIARNRAGVHGTGWMLGAVLERLRLSGKPYVVENVVGAPMPTAVELCGASFGLGVRGLDLSRHRRFECSFALLVPPCQHRRGRTVGVYGNGTPTWHRVKHGLDLSVADACRAMGIDWMTRAELSQAVPPAYTAWIGRRLLDVIR